jgi:hypothetical protein
MELDTKLELFKSINESTSNLSNIVEKYRDALSTLATETSNLGSFLKDCGKNSSSSGTVMINTGRVVNYLGQQYFSAMSSLTRSLQELNTFKRAVNDSKETIQVMEKERTEYRAALELMKSVSDIDPDSGRGLEKFRTSQKYVKFAKQKFDKYSLACLQKIDLLSAARCNLFSYSLAAYQANWITLSEKNYEVLEAHIKVIEKEPKTFQNFGVLKDLAQHTDEEAAKNEKTSTEKLNLNDEDQRLFFGDEFTDGGGKEIKENNEEVQKLDEKLIDYDGFDEFMSASSSILMPSQLLMDDNIFNTPTNVDLLGSLVPSQASGNENSSQLPKEENQLNKNPSKKMNDVNKWFQLFSELDPLNQQKEVQDASDNMHAA